MSYAVIRLMKHTGGATGGIQRHNERLAKQHKNGDIDPTRSHLNYRIDENNINEKYIDIANRIIKNEHKNDDRKLKHNAIKVCEFVVTSDKAFFNSLNEDEQRQFFQRAYDFLSERYGQQNIVAATVHLDERTPHMHFSFVPIYQGDQEKDRDRIECTGEFADKKNPRKFNPNPRLTARELFTPVTLRQLQTDYHKYLTEKGYDLLRGVTLEESKHHVKTVDYKKGQIKDAEQELQAKTETLSQLKNELTQKKKTLETADDVYYQRQAEIRRIETELETKTSQVEVLTNEVISKSTLLNEVSAIAEESEIHKKQLEQTKRDLNILTKKLDDKTKLHTNALTDLIPQVQKKKPTFGEEVVQMATKTWESFIGDVRTQYNRMSEALKSISQENRSLWTDLYRSTQELFALRRREKIAEQFLKSRGLEKEYETFFMAQPNRDPFETSDVSRLPLEDRVKKFKEKTSTDRSKK